MIEHNGYLFLNCPASGIFVFDIFGAFSKMVTVKDLRQFQVNQNIIYFQKDSLFCSYDYKLFDEVCKPLPDKGMEIVAKYYNGKLFSGYKDSLLIRPFK
jgi:hypothetical protein